MELTNIELLKYKENSVYEIRKLYNLHEPKRLKEAIDILEEWAKKQTHFLKRDFSREFYERKLIACKGSVEKAKRSIDSLCTMRTLLPNFFAATNAKTEFREVLEVRGMTPLPNMTEDLYRVIILGYSTKNLKENFFLQFYQFAIMIYEYLIKHDYNTGIVLIGDLRDVDIMYALAKTDLVEFQQFMTIALKGYSARLRNIILLSDSKYVDMAVKMLKQVLSAKIGDRIKVASNFEELATFIPREILPEDYGGTEISSDILKEKWLDAVSSEDHLEYMEMINKAATDESLRMSNKFNEDYVGMPGSFRALTVD